MFSKGTVKFQTFFFKHLLLSNAFIFLDVNITMYKDELATIIGDIFCNDELTFEQFELLFQMLGTIDSNEEFKFIRTLNLVHGACALVEKYSDNAEFCSNALEIVFHDFNSDKGIYKTLIGNAYTHFSPILFRGHSRRKRRYNDRFEIVEQVHVQRKYMPRMLQVFGIHLLNE